MKPIFEDEPNVYVLTNGLNRISIDLSDDDGPAFKSSIHSKNILCTWENFFWKFTNAYSETFLFENTAAGEYPEYDFVIGQYTRRYRETQHMLIETQKKLPELTESF
jgi:hypothetical protein